jgi:uncharacterized SAM-dependent methyltransferase
MNERAAGALETKVPASQSGEAKVRKVNLLTEEALCSLLRGNLSKGMMPDYFLYADEAGARRWLELAGSETFPIASRLTDLLESSALAIAAYFTGTVGLVSMGTGSGEKESLLLRSLMDNCEMKYVAVDVSMNLLEAAMEEVADLDIPKTAVAARFEDIGRIEDLWENSVLLCMLGNSFCNLDPVSALGLIRGNLGPGDAFLFDCAVLPEGASNGQALAAFGDQVEKAYGSELNMRFNLGPLVDRGLDVDACRFHLGFGPVKTPKGEVLRTSKRLEILEDSVISIGGEEVILASGDSIEMGFTYKYTPSHIRALLAHFHFDELAIFFSPDGEYMLSLVR